MKLSILICSLTKRKALLERLLSTLCPQVNKYEKDIEVLIREDNGQIPIGQKRNQLISEAKGQFICFIDDDDLVSDDYIEQIMNALKGDPDVVGIIGVMTTNGRNCKTFIHSLQYDHWFEKDGIYYRNNNHLNPVKIEYARQCRFPEINKGEDHDYSKQLYELLKGKKEIYIDNPIYFYDFRSSK